MLSRNVATAVLALSSAATSALARPQLAREPSLGYAAPKMIRGTEPSAPSLDVSLSLSVKPEISATMNNSDHKITVNDASGYLDVNITADASSAGLFQVQLPSEGTDKAVLAYDETKGALTIVPASTVTSPLPWKILCSSTKGTKGSAESYVCAIYFANEAARCAVKATGGFAIDAACDASKAKAPQLWEIRPAGPKPATV